MQGRIGAGGWVALSGVRTTPLGSSSSSRKGEGSEGQKGDVSIGENVASRASAGAALEGARKGKTSNEGRGMLPFLSVFSFSGMVPDGGCSPEGVGRGCRSDREVQPLVEEVRKGCSALSLSHGRGGVVFRPFFFCRGGSRGAAQTPRHLQRHRKRASAGGSADCIRA